ncbi:MAG: hypothetical protein ACNA8J_02475 [Gammaproteobacteria bacterium]
MADSLVPGMLVEETPGRETALEIFPAGVSAFVGAAPRGPVNEAVLIESLEDLDRLFGVSGAEHPLQLCVQDFFAAGGMRAAVVRVANGARPCTIRLPGREGPLVLEAVSPGRREYLRASVDYDHIGRSDDACFNLVVQRLRTPGTERVADQEIYQRLSLQPSSERYVVDILLESRLVRVQGSPPPSRPAATVSTAPGHPVTWVDAEDDGADGKALTDYDLVGSVAERSGLFALDGVGPVDFLALPAAEDGRHPGPALLLAALRYCRRRRAMLLLEPPPDTYDGDQALAWLRDLNIAGENSIAVFPRLAGDARGSGRPAAGAVAGALSRAPLDVEPALGNQFRPISEVASEMRRRLQAAGINLVGRGRGGRVVLAGDRTLASPECPVSAWRSLSARRLALSVERTLLQGTRWVVFEPAGRDLAQRLQAQLGGWLESLRFAGLLAGDAPEAWFVDVNEVSVPHRPAQVEFTVGFAPRKPKNFIIYRVSQGLHAARLAPVSAERWVITQPSHDAGAVPLDQGAQAG